MEIEMSAKERETRYGEAERYINRAIEIFRTKANKKGDLYQEVKYVKKACGAAYNGVLYALDTFLELNGKPIKGKRKERTNVELYRKQLEVLDKKLLDMFNDVHSILYRAGYHDGIKSYGITNAAMNIAIDIVNKIKPFGHSGLQPAI